MLFFVTFVVQFSKASADVWDNHSSRMTKYVYCRVDFNNRVSLNFFTTNYNVINKITLCTDLGPYSALAITRPTQRLFLFESYFWRSIVRSMNGLNHSDYWEERQEVGLLFDVHWKMLWDSVNRLRLRIRNSIKLVLYGIFLDQTASVDLIWFLWVPKDLSSKKLIAYCGIFILYWTIWVILNKSISCGWLSRHLFFWRTPSKQTVCGNFV